MFQFSEWSRPAVVDSCGLGMAAGTAFDPNVASESLPDQAPAMRSNATVYKSRPAG
jgi:hypothetical protein